jgi:hypothetical protein
MSDVTFVTAHTLSLDGFGYSISVYSKVGECFAYWDCERCQHQSIQSISAPDRKAVIHKCEQLIKQHHAEFHAVRVYGTEPDRIAHGAR